MPQRLELREQGITDRLFAVEDIFLTGAADYLAKICSRPFSNREGAGEQAEILATETF